MHDDHVAGHDGLALHLAVDQLALPLKRGVAAAVGFVVGFGDARLGMFRRTMVAQEHLPADGTHIVLAANSSESAS